MVDFRTADNIGSGMEFALTNEIIDGYAMIRDSWAIGRTSNTETELEEALPHGIVGPRSENFSIDNVRFFNYDWGQTNAHAAALGTCSSCSNRETSDSGARTITTSNLHFDSSVPVRIRYNYPFRGIFYDLDGTLTDLSPGERTWAVAEWEHLKQPECVYDAATLTTFGGILCRNTIEVRRLAFHSF